MEDRGSARRDRAPRLAAAGATWRRWAAAPVAVDAGVAVATCAAAIVALAVSDEPRARPADALGYALLAAACAPLVLGRRWPVGVLSTTGAVGLVLFVLGYPGGPLTVPLLVALYMAAAAGRRRESWAFTAVFAGAGTAFRAVVEQDPAVAIALNAALFVLVSLLGDLVYSRRALRAEVRDRLRRADAERDREARRRVLDERVRIARELHDVMAHTVTAMNVQAGVAADALDDDPDQARAALRTVRDGARDAMAELRATVSLLRNGDRPGPMPPAPRLDQLNHLLDAVRHQGLDVRLESSGKPQELSTALEVTAYRIVQEALTNVLRHAAATTVTVAVRHQPGALVIEIEDDGRGGAGPPGERFGLLGMRERAEAVGGHLEAGAVPGGGFRVHARLPAGNRS